MNREKCCFLVRGGTTLRGEVNPGGAKNAILPMMAASILATGPLELSNVPHLDDVNVLGKILLGLGGEVDFASGALKLDMGSLRENEVSYDLASRLRASVLLMGPLLARFKKARIPVPGGCDIGDRPIDQHLKAFSLMGAEANKEHGIWNLTTGGLKGAKIDFDISTVTGTENVLIGATLAEGETVINNAAMEPEIVDLAGCLRMMGAEIAGEGTSTITVRGVKELSGGLFDVMPDRIEVATLLLAGAVTGGRVKVIGAVPDHLESLLHKLEETGAEVSWDRKGLEVRATDRVKSVNLATHPYPGFPTDLQAQFMTYMCLGDSVSTIEENIFEKRFMHVAELRRLGADISVSGKVAVVKGVDKLSGAPITATDLRASAGLVLAGLVAEGETVVREIEHVDRGYENLEEKLNNLGAMITRIPLEGGFEAV